MSVLLAVALTPARPASAGGPTSVLLASPQYRSTASLYYTDPDYDRLAALLGEARGGGKRHLAGAYVTATWLMHDVHVWRTDRIYLEAPGGPRIATRLPDGSGGEVWHTSRSAGQLVALLTRLGLLGGEDAIGSAPAVAATSEAPEAAPPSRPVAHARDERLWGFYGLAAGVLLALATSRMVDRRRRMAPARR